MKLQWDDNDSAENLAKHGITLEEAAHIFKDVHLRIEHEPVEFGDVKFIALGRIAREIVIAVAHTDRIGFIKILSARRANLEEREAYRARFK
jgi:uncharacterized protein